MAHANLANGEFCYIIQSRL